MGVCSWWSTSLGCWSIRRSVDPREVSSLPVRLVAGPVPQGPIGTERRGVLNARVVLANGVIMIPTTD
ncbi:hypothetical protein FMUAM8_43050 [Nocardia cyriacigeorgica]|nr:hypothetical protein FMUAM8_43050 [Nocardia cyriacigeorgica]